MNSLWRAILRNRSLASIRLYRKPASYVHLMNYVLPGFGRLPPVAQPYIHLVFKKEFAEPWMTQFESTIPQAPYDWLANHGFGGMEHYEVRVGVVSG